MLSPSWNARLRIPQKSSPAGIGRQLKAMIKQKSIPSFFTLSFISEQSDPQDKQTPCDRRYDQVYDPDTSSCCNDAYGVGT
jgi:hypothetical protein